MRERVGCAGSGSWQFISRFIALAAIGSIAFLGTACHPSDGYVPVDGVAKASQQRRAKAAALDPALLKLPAAPDCEDKAARQSDDGKTRQPSDEGGRSVASDETKAPSAERALANAVPARPDGSGGAAASGGPNADMAIRIKLEYERECYRLAEARVREQLHRLQVSVGDKQRFYSRLEREYR